jgi:hypothetical protein
MHNIDDEEEGSLAANFCIGFAKVIGALIMVYLVGYGLLGRSITGGKPEPLTTALVAYLK